MSLTSYIKYLNKDEIVSELSKYGLVPDEKASVEVMRTQLRGTLCAARRGSIPIIDKEPVNLEEEITNATNAITRLENKADSGTNSASKRIAARSNYWLDRLATLKVDDSRLPSLRARLISLLSISEESEEEMDESETSVHERSTTVSERIHACDRTFDINSLNLKFDGTTCVRVFLERLEELKTSRNISDNQLLNSIPEILDKSPLLWYRANRKNFTNFGEFRFSLKHTYDKPDYDFHLMREIRDRRMNSEESLISYTSTMQSMFARLTAVPSFEDQVEILKHNIRPEYMETLEVNEFKSMNELIGICRQVELIRYRQDRFREHERMESCEVQPHKGKLAGVGKEPMSKGGMVNLASIGQEPMSKGGKRRTCFKCSSPNHLVRSCKIRKIICYKCGRQGVKTPYCPKCSPKLVRRYDSPQEKVLFLDKVDARPHLSVSVTDLKISGLLDSGSLYSILGNNSHQVFTKCGFKVNKSDQLINIHTANGSPLSCRGTMSLPVKFENRVQTIKFYIVPEVVTPVIFGCNFWQQFCLFERIFPSGVVYKNDNRITSCSAKIGGGEHASLATSRSERRISRSNNYQASPDATQSVLVDSISSVGITPERKNWYCYMFDSVKRFPNKYPNYRLKGKNIFRFCKNKYKMTSQSNWRLVVPEDIRVGVINHYHEEVAKCHLDIYQTHNRLAEKYFWPSMHTDIVKYVSGCMVCRMSKPVTTGRHSPRKVTEHLERSHQCNRKYYNFRKRKVELKVGQIVYKRTFYLSNASKNFSSKLAPKFKKCIVVAKLSPLVYTLSDMDGKVLGDFHIKDILKHDD